MGSNKQAGRGQEDQQKVISRMTVGIFLKANTNKTILKSKADGTWEKKLNLARVCLGSFVSAASVVRFVCFHFANPLDMNLFPIYQST
jgi:hypothetical protein